MSYIVAISRTPCVINVFRTIKGRPYLHYTLMEAHWRAFLALGDLDPGRYVEVRQGRSVVERMIKGMHPGQIHRWTPEMSTRD